MLDVVLIALLVTAVLGGLGLGPWLVAALVARRRDQLDLVIVLTRRASTSAFVLGALAILFPAGNTLTGQTVTAGAVGLVVAGLLLIAAGTVLRRVGPVL